MNKQLQLVYNYILATVVFLLFLVGTQSLCAQPITAAKASETKEYLSPDYQYYDLACSVDVWEGYFAPDRWQRSVVKAEPGELVQISEVSIGESKHPLVVLGQHQEEVETWSIEIPAAGYLSFRIFPTEGKGGEVLRVIINDRSIVFKRRADGLYYSPFLQAGDRFGLRIPAGKTIYHWTNLLFHTNYKAVIIRPEEVDPAKKFVPIEAALIQRVFFLTNKPGTWPTFDQDGDLSSVDDQFELRDSDARFTVAYHDRVEEQDGRFFLWRTFTIREKCSRGSWLRSSRRWAELPIIPE